MRKIILSLGFGLLGLWGIFGIYWATISTNNPKAGMGISVQMLNYAMNPYFIPGIMIYMFVMMGAAFWPLISGVFTNAKKRKHLAEVGQKTMAKIVSIQNTNIRVNDNPYVIMTVEVKPGVMATFKTIVSIFQIPQIGNEIEVLYDRANPSDAILAK